MKNVFNELLMRHEHAHERRHFKKLLAISPNYFGTLGQAVAGIVKPIAYNVYYEEISSIGYNPATETIEAMVEVKKSAGFSGSLCTTGSYEYVRFYLDYGTGWEDQGYAGFNTHDIITGEDCQQNDETPLSYAVTLKLDPKRKFCETAVMPKARAILSWNTIPTANTPDYIPVWGNVYECNIQIAPALKLIFSGIDFELNKVLQVAIANPSLNIAQAAETVKGGKESIKKASSSLYAKEHSIAELVNLYKDKKVNAGRFGLKTVKAVQYNPDAASAKMQIDYLQQIGFDWANAVDQIMQTSADTNYEELTDAGLDYNKEQFVASVHVKQSSGYSGSLCSAGSFEYVAFWADWNNNCEWEYIGTAAVNVHDVGTLPDGGLCYSATLPYDFTHKHKNCQVNNVVKIRAVLSWNTPPSTTDPNNLKTYGNLLDRYVQVKPGVEIPEGSVLPYFYVLGGIPVDKISNSTGLTTSGATFAFNANSVEEGAPFAGKVVIQGPSYPGYKYRIKVTNLNTNAFYYLADPLALVGYNQFPLPPHPTHFTINPDVNNYYDYQNKGIDFDDNVDNVLARWTPGGDDKWQIDLDIQGIFGVFSKVIQMDNTAPTAVLSLNNNGDCTHYHLGQTIMGTYTATDDYISSFVLSASFVGTVESGNANTTNNTFAFTTAPDGTPCGSVDLKVFEKTIHDSVTTGNHSDKQEIVCLQPQL